MNDMACSGFRSASFGLGTVAAGLLLGTTAHADDVMAPRYGNTTNATDATGTVNSRIVKLVQGIQ
jgi:hypothetical protein